MQWEAVDETGQAWIIVEGDKLSYIWTENPWLPDKIMAPRRLFLDDEGERPVPTQVRREDALNDGKIKQAVNERIWTYLNETS